MAIAHRYRDDGHPQFWGRIIGTSGDTEDAQWLLNTFRQIGMTDNHVQPISIPPQWIAQSWEVSAVSGGKALTLLSAQPFYATPATQGLGLDAMKLCTAIGLLLTTTANSGAGEAVRAKSRKLFCQMKQQAEKNFASVASSVAARSRFLCFSDRSDRSASPGTSTMT